jgi:hypothetical protein
MGEFVRLRGRVWAPEEDVKSFTNEIGHEPEAPERKPAEHEKPAVAAQL